jgi:hypothetical protein
VLALTFEAGGDPGPAAVILTLLREENLRATFFLDGRWAETHPELVRQMVQDGHELGNHGYSHPDWTELKDEEIVSDLESTERVVESLVRLLPKPWARPPYGAVNPRVLDVLQRAGYHAVYRDAVDGGHWPGETTPASIRKRALSTASDGAVIVFHTDRQDTAAALPDLLPDLSARFKLGTLSQLGVVPSPRLDLHPDFAELDINPGYITPKAAGRWRSLNLLELGASFGREPNQPQAVAESGGSRLDLITGDPSTPFEQPATEADRHLLVLAGEVRCRFAAGSGQELGTVLARRGDLVLLPSGAAARLSSGKRWTGTLLHPADADES